jgi:protein-S-isoprenylcysteine O-methyltransferase Ste14
MSTPSSSSPAKPASNFGFIIAVVGISLMLLVSGIQAFTATGVYRWLTPVIAVLYVLWIASEFRITTDIASKDTSSDQYTCEAYAIARFVTMLAAFGMGSIWTEPGVWLPLGLTVFIGGIALRAWAIRTLGRSYSHRVRTPAAQQIVDSGPYRHLRHPAYTGMLIAHVGILLLFCNVFVAVALFAVFLPALVRRIRVEERHLLQIPAYREFAVQRARLAPGVW